MYESSQVTQSMSLTNCTKVGVPCSQIPMMKSILVITFDPFGVWGCPKDQNCSPVNCKQIRAKNDQFRQVDHPGDVFTTQAAGRMSWGFSVLVITFDPFGVWGCPKDQNCSPVNCKEIRAKNDLFGEVYHPEDVFTTQAGGRGSWSWSEITPLLLNGRELEDVVSINLVLLIKAVLTVSKSLKSDRNSRF